MTGPWEFMLLVLGAYRLWRILARDTITEPFREAVTGYDDEEAPSLHEVKPSAPPENPSNRETRGLDRIEVDPEPSFPPRLRVYLSTLIRCPWCLGFYMAVAVYVVWRLWPYATLVAMTPLAISTVLGLVRKNLDP